MTTGSADAIFGNQSDTERSRIGALSPSIGIPLACSAMAGADHSWQNARCTAWEDTSEAKPIGTSSVP